MMRRFIPITWLLLLFSLSACGDFEYRGKDADYYFPEPIQSELAKAAARGDIDEMEERIAQGADINYAGRHDFTVLYWSMLADQFKAMERLLDLGVDPNQKMHQGKHPLFTTAAMYETPKYLKLLLENGVGIETTRGKYTTALDQAAMYGRMENAKFLVANCANLNHADMKGATAVVTGLLSDEFAVSRYLLEQGTNHHLPLVALYLGKYGRPKSEGMRNDYDAMRSILEEYGINMDLFTSGPIESPNAPPKPVYGKDCRNPPSG